MKSLPEPPIPPHSPSDLLNRSLDLHSPSLPIHSPTLSRDMAISTLQNPLNGQHTRSFSVRRNKGILPARVVSINKNCINCSGDSGFVMSAFKMACLKYNSSSVKYGIRSYPRVELMNIRQQLLTQCLNLVSATDLFRAQKSIPGLHITEPIRHSISTSPKNISIQPGVTPIPSP